MAAGDRWTRMGELVNIDLEKFRSQVAEFERDLDASKNQLTQLAEYCAQTEKQATQLTEYQSVASITRQHSFVASLRDAMRQQQGLIAEKVKRLDQMKAHLFELYKTKESYNVIAAAQNAAEKEKQDKDEAEFLDELATQGFMRQMDFDSDE
ncbi:MAG: flagellar export protein FliJ [Pseudomonadota bacterium]|nr:flagellar export protein FliJ [Pseudomonadota bacterium]